MRTLKLLKGGNYFNNDNSYEDVNTRERFIGEDLVKMECKVLLAKRDVYYKYGMVHRQDGPARIWYSDTTKQKIHVVEYFLNNQIYSREDWLKLISKEDRVKYFFTLGEVS